MRSFEEASFKKDLKQLLKRYPYLLSKVETLVIEVRHHPRMGLGHPKPLVGYGSREVWSRHISGKHRLVYEIKPDCIVFIACYGHYDDH